MKQKVVLITGPTAAGKTDIAIAVAKYLGGNRQMIGDIIEATFNSNRNIGSALSLCLMVVILIFIILANRFGDEEAVGV